MRNFLQSNGQWWIPSLVLAAGVLASTALAAILPGSGWWIGTLVFLLSILATDVAVSRLQSNSSGLSSTAIIVALAFLFGIALVAIHDTRSVAMFIGAFGGGIGTPILFRLRRNALC